jgi:hypothetical protein
LPIEFFRPLLDSRAELFEKGIRRVIQDRMDGVQAEGIEMELGDPVERVINEEASYMIALRPIEIQSGAPRSFIELCKVRRKIG